MTSTDVVPAKTTTSHRAKVQKRRTSGRPTKYDWEPVRVAYIEGTGTELERAWPGLKDLSEKYKIPYVRVRERSSQERWPEQRAAFMSTLEQARQKERSKQLAKEAVQFDASALDVAQLGIDMVTARMQEIAEHVMLVNEVKEKIRKGELDIDITTVKTNIKANELNQLSLAALQWHQLGQRALGTDVINANINIGGEIEHTISVTQELMRDDPERLAGFLEAAVRTGIISVNDDFLVIEGEVVDESETIEGGESD